MEKEKKKQLITGVAVVAGAAIVGYFVYEKLIKPQIDKPIINKPPQDATAHTITAPALPDGVPDGSTQISKGQQVVAVATSVAPAKVKGDRYVKITAMQNEQGRDVITFKSPINGYFTGRVFTNAGNYFAEVIRA